MNATPPTIAKMMTGRATTIRHCITAQEAARGPQEMMKGNKSCIFSRYVLAGGKIDAEMTCSQGGGTMTAVTTGTYTATTMASKSHIVMKGPTAMTMTTMATGKRIGGC